MRVELLHTKAKDAECRYKRRQVGEESDYAGNAHPFPIPFRDARCGRLLPRKPSKMTQMKEFRNSNPMSLNAVCLKA